MKEQIITKAGEMFLKYGLRSVSVDDICNEMRISKKTFYNVFKTKEALVAGLLDKVLEDSVKVNIAVKDGETVIDFMRDNTKKFMLSQTMAERHVSFFYDLSKYYPELQVKFSGKMDEIRSQQSMEFIAMGQSEGVFRNDLNVAVAANVINAMMKVALTRIPGTTMEERSREVLDFLLRILGTEDRGMKTKD